VSRLVLVAALLGLLSSVPLSVFNGFHLLSLIVAVLSVWVVVAADAPVCPGHYSRLDRLDGLPHVPGDRRA
jgi:hypothetical protein